MLNQFYKPACYLLTWVLNVSMDIIYTGKSNTSREEKNLIITLDTFKTVMDSAQ